MSRFDYEVEDFREAVSYFNNLYNGGRNKIKIPKRGTAEFDEFSKHLEVAEVIAEKLKLVDIEDLPKGLSDMQRRVEIEQTERLREYSQNPKLSRHANYSVEKVSRMLSFAQHILGRGEGGMLMLSRGPKDVTRKLFGIVSIVGVAGSILFFSSNLTGNAISNLTNSTSNILGVVFLALALVGGFFWFRSKKKIEVSPVRKRKSKKK